MMALLAFSPLLMMSVPPERKGTRNATVVLLGLSFGIQCFAALVVYQYFWSVDTAWLITAGFLFASLAISIPLIWRYRSISCAGFLVTSVAIMMAMHLCDFTPVKPYKRFFAAIQTGMTEQEVMAAVHKQFPCVGSRYRFPAINVANGEPKRIGFIISPVKAYNGNGIWVTLKGGRVTDKVYLPD